MTTKDSVPLFFDTPEKYFVPHPAITDIEVDALHCALLRAEAIVAMLQSEFNGASDIRHSDAIITNALWAIEGCIEQAKAIVLQPGRLAHPQEARK